MISITIGLPPCVCVYWPVLLLLLAISRLLESKRKTKERQQLVRTNKKSLEGLVMRMTYTVSVRETGDRKRNRGHRPCSRPNTSAVGVVDAIKEIRENKCPVSYIRARSQTRRGPTRSRVENGSFGHYERCSYGIGKINVEINALWPNTTGVPFGFLRIGRFPNGGAPRTNCVRNIWMWPF